MLRRLAASTLATIITDAQRQHPGIDTAKLVQFVLYDLVEWCNRTSHAIPDSCIGEIAVVPDTCLQMPAGYMHARCIAYAVMQSATDALTAIDWGVINDMNPHQLTVYIAGTESATTVTICEHTDALEPISDTESLFSI